MNKQYLLGIDVGTGSVKAALFERSGKLAGFGQHQYDFIHPKPMWSELHPKTVWDKTVLAVKDCMKASGIDRKKVAGVGISCIGDTGIALDRNGEPVYPAIESTDQRGDAYKEYVNLFERRIGGSRIFGLTGYPLSSLSPAHKILWLRENMPSVYSKMARYGTFQEYLLWKMTGNPVVDHTLASRTMLFDIVHKKWVSEFLNAVEIPGELLSDTVPSSNVAGYLKDIIASEMGLPAELPVIAGAHDQCCSALGMGLLNPGMVGDGAGSVEALLCISDSASLSPGSGELGLSCQCHALPDKYLSIAFQLTAGSLVRWYRDQFCNMENLEAADKGLDVYDIITSQANKSQPGAGGLMLLPHFLGSGTCRRPPINSSSRGVMLGLSLSHNKNDISRSLFEGITFEMKYLLDVMSADGKLTEAIVTTGGAARSPFWMQMKADITGIQVLVPEVTETSCLGAAILAGIGTGVYDSYQDACNKACHIKMSYLPDKSRHQTYNRFYEIYKDVYDTVESLNSRLVKCNREILNEGC